MSDSKVKVFGTLWCFETQIALEFFEQNEIGFEWVDIDQSPEGDRFVRQVNRGNRSVPTILFADGSTLTEPSKKDLREIFLGKS